MLIGLATLLIILLGSGNESFLLNPEMKKSVNIYVTDKENKKEIDATIKLMEKHEKEFAKKKSKYYEKKTIELNKNYTSKRSEFDTLYLQFNEDDKANQIYYWKCESKIRSLITDSEWKNIIAKSTKEPEKEKDRDKLLKSINKLYEGIQKICEREIQDSTSKKLAAQLISQQKSTLDSLTNNYFNLNYHHVNTLEKRDATFEDYTFVLSKLDELRSKLLNEFTTLRFDLVKTTTKQEWSEISKELDKLFNETKDFMI